MSSSDSEDDCYSNAAQRLKKLKNTFKVDAYEGADLLNDSAEIDEIIKNAGLAKPAKKTPQKRGKKAADPPSTSSSVPAETTSNVTSKRMTRAAARNSAQESVLELPDTPVTTPSTAQEPPASAIRGRRGRRGNSNQTATPRGRRRGRGQDIQTSVDTSESMLSGRRRGRAPRRARSHRQHTSSFLNSISAALPIFSIGNTYDYPDECQSQELFSSNAAVAKKDDDVIEVDANDSLDENEELSVKVYWQSSDFFRFNLRRFQKISQIFDYFSKKENVAFGNLLFTYNDKILKPDDTPDSIDYNIGKFIDGGIVSKNVTELIQNDKQGINGGLKLKFQCQNVKKPFELSVFPDEALYVAMLKCAEHIEQSIDKLKFYFDGDVISRKSTARELELEGGECIDVKVLN